jgi:hypothetical protein
LGGFLRWALQQPSTPQLGNRQSLNAAPWVTSAHTHPSPTPPASPPPPPPAPQIREKAIADQFEARRAKGKATRERKAARREERQASGLHLEQPVAAAVKPAAKK